MIETSTPKTNRQKAGHYEILGETYAQFEFFEQGWNPYSRFLDVDKVDFILRRREAKGIEYREVQVKYGKLYECTTKWERTMFDITSWRFFRAGEFDSFTNHDSLFMAFIFAADIGYRGDIFIFPIKEFVRLLHAAVGSGERKTWIISHSLADGRWFLRKKSKFDALSFEDVEDVTPFRRAFHLLG